MVPCLILYMSNVLDQFKSAIKFGVNLLLLFVTCGGE